MSSRLVHVAVGVIVGEKGEILIAKRSDEVHQGGLWEFSGGKVEQGETVFEALKRELQEELAIHIIAGEPLIKIRHDYGDKVVLLDVYKVTKFIGQPQGNEGQPILWVAPNNLQRYEFPAANQPIIAAINLPRRLLITGEAENSEEYLYRTERALKTGIQLVQLRVAKLFEGDLLALIQSMAELCARYNARLQLNMSAQDFLNLENLPEHLGLHLNSKNVEALNNRPIAKNIFLSASCHNAEEILQAQKLEADFIVLSPVLPTQSHPQAELLGWQNFAALIEPLATPVYALGGMSEAEYEQAILMGAQGIAAISAWW